MFYKIGHRGAAGHAPENTLSSFKKALSLNVDMIELDVHLCRSGEVVVIHNKDTKKIDKKKGLIKNKTWAELQKINIPKLEEVLDLIKGRTRINIELKSPKTAQPVAEIINKYLNQKNWSCEKFLISSFNRRELKEIKQHLPQIKIGLLISHMGPVSFWINKLPLIFNYYLKTAERLNAFSLNIHRKLVTPKIIQVTQAQNIKAFIYTVNNPAEIRHLKEMGVDGIFSDYPDRL